MSMIDRSKFKATSVSKINEASEVAKKTLGIEDKGRPGYLKLKPGKNTLRIAPFHPEDGGQAYAEPMAVYWLPMLLPKRDDNGIILKDNKGNEIFQESKKSIFDSRLHGNTEKDLIDEYIKFAGKLAKFNYSKESDQKSFLTPIYGNRQTKEFGITVASTSIVYAWLIQGDKKEFGRFELKRSVADQMNAIAAIEAENEPLGTDPFTDIEFGRALVINYNPNAEKAQDYYRVALDASYEREGPNKGKVKFYPLSDEEINQLLSVPSLYKQYRNVYSLKDFSLALKGLQFFDEKHRMGILNHDDFLSIVEEIKSYYPSEQLEEQEEEEAEENSKDNSLSKMDRIQLKEFIKANSLGITVMKSHTDDQLRNLIRKAQETSFEEKETEEDEIEEHNDLPWEKGIKSAAETKKETAAVVGESVADKVSALKKQLKKS